MKNTTSLTRRNLTVALSAFPALIALGTPVFAEGPFIDLGNLGGTYTYPNALSADGTVVVGRARLSEYGQGTRAFRWDSLTGIQNLEIYPGSTYANATAVSADGKVNVGVGYDDDSKRDRAFRWENGQAINLGTLYDTDNYSRANAVSANGAVVVGEVRGSTTFPGEKGSEEVEGPSYGPYSRAFRWEKDMMQDLGTLGGNNSYANFVSADGAVVVGGSTIAGNSYNHAFRWENGVMEDLETLGGNISFAYGLSADGKVVIGYSKTEKNQFDRAFRWKDGKMQDLGALNDRNSYARDVSADGAVVVGYSTYAPLSSSESAFRWEGDVMAHLGALDGHTSSRANAVSADGLVVVGMSRNSGSEPEEVSTFDVAVEEEFSQAFRWSTTEGMQSVADWVTAAGGAIPEGYALTDATDVNDDGSVVTGYGSYNNKDVAWLAKGNGFLSDTDAFDRSIVKAGGSAVSVGIAATNLALNGSHHRTLLDSGLAMSENGTCAWSTVDAARNDTTKATNTLGEIGICGDVAGYRIGAGVGTTKTKQDWDLGGSARYSGDYFLAEVGREFATAGGGTLQASLLVYHAAFDTTLNRAYASGGGIDISTGRPDMKASAVKARLDWKNATKMGAFSVSPYGALTVTRAKVAGYTEAGGAFPAVYAPTTTTTTDLRIGAAFSGKIAPKITLHAQVEAVHQFQDATAGINGQVTGLYAFNLPGQKMTRNWGRITVDVDYALTPTTILTAGFGASTKSSQSSPNISLGIRASF